MNEFIKLRNCTNYSQDSYAFPLLLLNHYIDRNKNINLKESLLIKKIQTIEKIDFKGVITEKYIYKLFFLLGEDSYLDRFIVDTLLDIFDNITKEVFIKIINNIIKNKKYNSQKLYHIVDICIECNMNLLNDEDLFYMFEKYKSELDIVSNLIDYLDSFKREGFRDYLYDLLEFDYPNNIKIQLLNFTSNIYPSEEIHAGVLNLNIRTDKNKIFIDNYIDFLNGKSKFKVEGFSVLQSMFYGDFEDSGKGNNGGLAVLLKSLGNEVSRDKRVSFVFTISITERLDQTFISYYKDKHVYIRLPIYIDKSLSDPFIKRELFIKRYINNFLKKADVNPDVFHIRYLDNASRSVAKLSKELNKKLVLTLTPDPHRNMFDEFRKLKIFSFSESIEKLNKIKIGDELIYKSDGILGIGNNKVRDELEMYFPQLKEKIISSKLEMIGEGIYTNDSPHDIKGNKNLSNVAELLSINKDFFERPIVLNVGRLAISKGQIELVKAWSNSKMSITHNLLLIGGDLENPSSEEKIIINFLNDYVKSNPCIKDKFCHKSAMANKNIRLIEKDIMKKSLDYPHIYLCSSIKEEFGISILEAMSQGFLIIAPKKGGVKSYIKNGVNGFLIDTSNWQTIAAQSEKYIYDSKLDRDKFRQIQEAGKNTVDELFSIRKIANKFLLFYLSLKGAENDEI